MTIPILAGSLIAILCAHTTFAAGSEMDILLKKLQQKGILTAAEADEIAQKTRHAAATEQKAAAEKEVAQKALSSEPFGG